MEERMLWLYRIFSPLSPHPAGVVLDVFDCAVAIFGKYQYG